MNLGTTIPPPFPAQSSVVVATNTAAAAAAAGVSTNNKKKTKQNTNHNNQKKVLLPPYPISIELYNAVPNYHSIMMTSLTSSSSSSSSSSITTTVTNTNVSSTTSDHLNTTAAKKGRSSSSLYYHRPEYSTKLLTPIHLEIIISNNEDPEDIDDVDDHHDNDDADHHPNNKVRIDNQQQQHTETNDSIWNGTSCTTPVMTVESLMRKPSTVALYSSSSTGTASTSAAASFISIWSHIHEAITDDQLRILRTTPNMYESISARFATTVPITNNNNDHNHITIYKVRQHN
jgi:hypothetical protein